MAKQLKDDPVTASDIEEFVENSTDFGFELRVMSELISMEINCEHGGTYRDPVTGKPRQFDIRSFVNADRFSRVRMAIECKNLRENFPLVVLTVPRIDSEDYHCLGFSQKPSSQSLLKKHGRCLHMINNYSIYPVGEPVGKSCSQVGRVSHNDGLTGNDAEVYEKWYQAIHSAHDLVDRARLDWKDFTNFHECCTLVLPILVVPNDRLWTVHYSSSGQRIGTANKADRVSFYIDKSVAPSDKLAGMWYSLSHLEIFTENGLYAFCREIKERHFIESAFPREGIEQALQMV